VTSAAPPSPLIHRTDDDLLDGQNLSIDRIKCTLHFDVMTNDSRGVRVI
jgi:hypothetical protein